MMLTRDDILAALSRVKDRASNTSVTESGMISGITVRPDGRVGFLITVSAHEAQEKVWLQAACEREVAALPGVTGVTAVLTAESHGPAPEANAPPARKAQWNTNPIPHVKRLIAVASGKGGVGKSTTAVNLAHALKAVGKNVGLLDADIYGPSIPRMMGLKGTPEAREGRITPPVAHGIACMSMGLLVGEESALVWRGPQMSKAIAQLLRGVTWGSEAAPLDVLLIDMPPGTGDTHLSLVQQAQLDGVVIVTTPQDVAVADARKCIDMFNKVHVQVLGVIENMSGFADPTGKVHAIFGAGGGRKLAESCAVPFLGEVPIEMALREASDAGIRFPDAARIYARLAQQLV